MESIGRRIRRIREDKRLSQRKLADLVGIKQPSLSDIEAERTTPRDATLIAIARALGDDLGQPWLGRYLVARRQSWEELMMPVLHILRTHDYLLDLIVVQIAKNSERFKSMLKPGELEEAERRAAEIRELIDSVEKGTQAGTEGQEIVELGNVDEFDVEEAVKKYDNGPAVLKAWYEHDRLPVPPVSVVAFSDWDKQTLEGKVREVKELRRNLDEDLYFEERRRASSTKPKHS